MILYLFFIIAYVFLMEKYYELPILQRKFIKIKLRIVWILQQVILCVYVINLIVCRINRLVRGTDRQFTESVGFED